MNILFLSNSLGGLRNFRFELIKTLLQRGDKVIIASNIEEESVFFSDLGCDVFSTPMDLRGKNPFSDIRLLFIYIKLLYMLNPDIVLTYTIKPNVYGGLACRILNLSQIASVTGLGTAFGNKNFITKIAIGLYKVGLSKCKSIFFQNSESFELFQAYGIALNNIKNIVYGSGVNLERFIYYEYPIDENGLNFLFVGRTRKEKGIDHYLKAAEFIQKSYSNCVFHIVGPCEEGYEEIINDFQNRNLIKYHGYQKNITSYLQKAHCCILPSYHEGMSNFLLESSACGRPTIATNIAGCREVIEDGLTGFLIAPKNTDDLIEKIQRFIKLTFQQKKQMGVKARKRMVMFFNREEIVNQYIKEIDRCALKNK